MPNEYFDIKAEIVEQLWLPITQEGSAKLYPHRRKNRGMKLFTLTDRHYEEIKNFERNNLIRRDMITVWNCSQQDVYRLETELGRSKVLDLGRFEDTIVEDPASILDCMPCDILNFDYTSQNPLRFEGRLEKEISGLEITIRRLHEIDYKGFVLIYTTIIDNVEVDLPRLSFPLTNEENIQDAGYDDSDGKVLFIKTAIDSIILNNNFETFRSNERILDIPDDANKIFSLACIYLRS